MGCAHSTCERSRREVTDDPQTLDPEGGTLDVKQLRVSIKHMARIIFCLLVKPPYGWDLIAKIWVGVKPNHFMGISWDNMDITGCIHHLTTNQPLHGQICRNNVERCTHFTHFSCSIRYSNNQLLWYSYIYIYLQITPSNYRYSYVYWFSSISYTILGQTHVAQGFSWVSMLNRTLILRGCLQNVGSSPQKSSSTKNT